MIWRRLRHVRPGELPWRARALLADVTALVPRPSPALGAPRWPTPLRRPDGIALDALRSIPPAGDDPGHLHPGWRDRPSILLPWRREDVRPVWEQHRLRHLQREALLGRWLDDPTRTACARDALIRYLADDRPGRGLGWISALEVAHRAVSVLLVRALVGPVPGDSAFLAASGRHLAAHPSIGSSLGNHTVGEAVALAVIGALCPGLRRADHWRALGLRRLGPALRHVIGPAGDGRERAPHYTAAVLEWAVLVRATQGAVPARRRLARAAEALSAWVDAGAPARGDSDGSTVIAAGDPDPLASIAGCAASALGVPGPRGWRPDGRAAVLGVGPGIDGARAGTTGGWTTLRAHIDGQDWVAVVGLGPTGMPPLASHGHDDGGSVWLTVGGVPVLVDRGTPTYAGDVRRRTWCRSAAAHTVPLVDGRGPADPVDVFAWRSTGRAALRRRTRSEVVVDLTGWADRSVVRTVTLGPAGLRITDRVVGTPPAHTALWLHLPPGARVRAGRASVPGAAPVAIDGSAPLTLVPTTHAPHHGVYGTAPSLRMQPPGARWSVWVRPL